MRKISLSIAVLSVSVFVFLSNPVQAESVAVLKEIQGEVYIQADQGAWTPVTQETPVNNLDAVKTGNGSCLLVYGNQGSFQLQPNTSLVVDQKTENQNLNLKLGSLRAKINKSQVTKPFQVVTPTAIGAVRGTEVDFDFNEAGELIVDLHNDGPVQVYNEEGLELTLENGNKVFVKYDKEKGELTVTNDCNSGGTVSFSFLDQEFSLDKCGSKTISGITTATGPNETPNTNQGNEGNENNPNENEDEDEEVTPSSSPITPEEIIET